MSMKKLRPSTIIPDELYTVRDADRQLYNIIQEMGRPGYVLVARQMGKTNLLLAAKRKLEDSNNFFIYIDLSNKFKDIRGCFRNIIDTAIKANPVIFKEAKGEIYKSRQDNEQFPPHVEHEQELLMLLGYIPEKLVIILDEIDALINVDFSDELFAQIRSVYFSRVNFPDFNRLTYILSGVAEPSEIIKNKNISPFNIGEKIYLDDFTYEEHLDFINRSKLDIPFAVVERIYYWASGNPRMTWDICSAVEDDLIEGAQATALLVDEVVQKLYLTNFDRPPIDHIRKLCEDSREVRSVLLELKNDQHIIDDAMKRKLYLAGMIRSEGFQASQLKLKNRIIESSLSEQWLKDVEKRAFGLLKLGREKFSQDQYQEAIDLLNQYLEETTNPDPSAYTDLGHSYYWLRQYANASKYLTLALEKDPTLSKYAFIASDAQYFLGMSNYYSSKYVESIDNFQYVINILDSRYALHAKLNLSGAYSKVDYAKYEKDIIELNEQLVASIDNLLNAEDGLTLKTVALYNLGNVYSKKDSVKAERYFEDAVTVADVQSVPAILLACMRCNLDGEIRIRYIKRIVDHILNNNLVISEDEQVPLAFSRSVLLEILFEAEETDLVTFETLLKYSSDHLFDSSEIPLIHQFAMISFKIGKSGNGKKIINKLLLNATKTDFYDPDKLRLLKVLIFNSKSNEFGEYEKLYFDAFKESYFEVELLDIRSFVLRISDYIKTEQFDLAAQLIELINQRRDNLDFNVSANFLAIDYFTLQYLFAKGKLIQVFNLAGEMLDLIQKLEDYYPPELIFTNADFQVIKETAEEARKLYPGDLIRPIKIAKKYGRNDVVTVKYKDGSLVTKKYKKVEPDLLLGLCEVVPI